MSGAMWSIVEEHSELSNSFVSNASSIPDLEMDKTRTQKIRQKLKSQIRKRRKCDQSLNKGLKEIENDVALHVEPDNPAKKLYERLGFTNKYLEMRLTK